MKSYTYDAIVFDLGNVLINFDYQIAVDRFDRIEPGLGKRFLEYHKTNYHIHRSFEKGLISEKEFIQTALKGVDFKIDRNTFTKIYSDIFTPNDDVIALLPQLRNNHKLFLMSNTDPLHKEYGWEKYEFLNQFNYLVLSFEIGAVKPEEKIYKTVESISQVKPEKLLYIDDIEDYVITAKNLGWDAIQFKNYLQLCRELENREIL